MSRKTVILLIIVVLAAVLTACNDSDPTDSPVSPLNSPLGSSQDAAPIPATLDSPFQLQLGQTALLQAQDLSVEFLEIVEDSRCPMGVECVWAGQAQILIRVSSGDRIQELTLLLEVTGGVTSDFDGYSFELLALDPYPQASGQDVPAAPAYTATLAVSQ